MIDYKEPDMSNEMISVHEEVGVRAIGLLAAFFFILAIFYLDTKIHFPNELIRAALASGLVMIVLFVLWKRERNFHLVRWFPFFTILVIPILVGWLYDFSSAVVLMMVAIAVIPLLINIWVGGSITLAYSIVILYFISTNASYPPGYGFISIAGLWMVFGLIAIALKPYNEYSKWFVKGYYESRRMLEEARNVQGELSQLVQERTEANMQLARLNQLANNLRQIAEDERKIKEEFVANVSHELRTPLNMIIGFSRVILQSADIYRRKLPHILMTDLEVILRNSQHLSNLINDILDLSQINAGQMAIVKEPVNIEELIDEALATIKPLFEARNLFLSAEVSPDLPGMMCDRTRISEVLLNLLSNACRFTEEGGVTVRALVDHQDMLIQVCDTGIGISPEKQQHLFDPFYQVDFSIRRKYGGTGLGLSISKKIVELHDGKMRVESKAGKGSVISFQLPITSFQVPESVNSITQWINPYQPEFHSPGRPFGESGSLPQRVVIVDTIGDMEQLLRRHFGEGDYVSYYDIVQAIEDIKSSSARFLLVNTQEISRTIEYFNQAERLPFGVPAIICSIPGVKSLIGQPGISDMFVKPIINEQLLAAVERLGESVQTILVIDDDPEMRMLFQRIFSGNNRQYQILTASNGLHGLQVIKRQPVDVIILDLVMPHMDGSQFLEARKSIPGCENIPVILISGHLVNEHPVVSEGLGISLGGGLSIQQFLRCLNAFAAILAPEPESGPGSAKAPDG